MTIKLNLLFIAMDLLTLLVYPFVFLHGKMHGILKPQKVITPIRKLTATSAVPVFDPL